MYKFTILSWQYALLFFSHYMLFFLLRFLFWQLIKKHVNTLQQLYSLLYKAVVNSFTPGKQS